MSEYYLVKTGNKNKVRAECSKEVTCKFLIRSTLVILYKIEIFSFMKMKKDVGYLSFHIHKTTNHLKLQEILLKIC